MHCLNFNQEQESMLTKRWMHHRSTPNVGIHSYRRAVRYNLGKAIGSKKLIYLDLKYWIYLRDGFMGRARSAVHDEILQRLLTLVQVGQCLCPFSFPIFDELLEQDDPVTRQATAQVIDALSLSICIQDPFTLAETELYAFLQKFHSVSRGIFNLRDYVWTGASYCAGEMIPTKTAFPPVEELVVQKVMDDLLMSETLESVVQSLYGSQRKAQDNFHSILNDNNSRRGSNLNFGAAYTEELAGAIDAYHPSIRNALSYLFEAEHGHSPAPSDYSIERRVHRLKTLIFRLVMAGPARKELPSIHIHAAIHGAIRATGSRRYKPTDLSDFQHAALALPYYDIFFTENSLAHLITHPPLKLDTLYGSTVLSREEDAMNALLRMERSS
jgi:hypothetical protein